MSDFSWKPNNGGLFLNKGKGPKFKGEINIDGKVIKLAAWEKETKNGDPWYSLSVDTFVPRAREERRGTPDPDPTNGATIDDFNDPVPF